MNRLLHLLQGFDVFFVGLHCPLPELERRERKRGDRKIGEAKTDYQTIHTFCTYDIEIDSTNDLSQNVEKVITAWKVRQRPSAFEKMAERLGSS
jgi:chloramphenicol 3-O phosphotransferase